MRHNRIPAGKRLARWDDWSAVIKPTSPRHKFALRFPRPVHTQVCVLSNFIIVLVQKHQLNERTLPMTICHRNRVQTRGQDHTLDQLMRLEAQRTLDTLVEHLSSRIVDGTETANRV